MSQFELLIKTTTLLNSENIPYVLVGSFVSSIYGEPRTTQDIDLVVQLQKSNIPKLISMFPPPRYYIEEEMILFALEYKRMFNLLDTSEGDKIDFYIQKDEDYEKEKFSRKLEKILFGHTLVILSPEDTILSKLQWCVKSGMSEKQFKDALNVFRFQKENLDMYYIEEKSKLLLVSELFEKIKEIEKS
jgi:hypothetical protein